MSIFDSHKDGIAPSVVSENGTVDEKLRQQFKSAMVENKLPQAFQLYKQLPNKLKHAYLDADDVYPLAKYAADERKSEEALAIVEGFSKRFPEHPDVVKNYLIAAEVMQTQFNEREQAQALLARLENYYADHADAPLIAKVKEKLQ